MVGRIKVLDELTINQIAAGEVIENPSSVVKELVENSLDAGSTEITIEIKGGGRQLIRVTDNGCGMSRDDAILCIERYATSKLKNFEDLFSLSTMGFRGEALPSIASISQFMLLTRHMSQGEGEGTLVTVEGGRIIQCTSCPRTAGTTIEVKNLFFNVPVRRKFQKSPAIDSNDIVKNVTAIALAHPRTRFELITETKQTLIAPKNENGDFLEVLNLRIKDTLGFEFLEELVPISIDGDYRLEGYASLPFHNRPNKSSQFLFVNGRYVFSPLVSFAIKEGYGYAMPTGRFPSFILHLTLPCDEFDINVHPQKKEVRFRREEKLKGLLKTAIEDAIQQENKNLFTMPEVTEAFAPSQYATYKVPEMEKSFSFPSVKADIEKPLPLPKMAFKPICVSNFRDFIVLESPPESLEGQEGICFAHIRHAYSRIIYEKALHSLLGQKNSFGSQALTVPLTLELSPEDTEILKHNLSSFGKLGFDIREIGQRNFFVESLPEHVSIDIVEEVLKNMIASLKTGENSFNWQKDESQKIALAAAKSATLKKKLTVIECQSLINQLFDCQQPYFSPFGHAIFAVIKEEMLQNLFKK